MTTLVIGATGRVGVHVERLTRMLGRRGRYSTDSMPPST